MSEVRCLENAWEGKGGGYAAVVMDGDGDEVGMRDAGIQTDRHAVDLWLRGDWIGDLMDGWMMNEI